MWSSLFRVQGKAGEPMKEGKRKARVVREIFLQNAGIELRRIVSMQMLLRGPWDRDCPNEIGPTKPLLTLAGPVPWKGNGKPGCRGLRCQCKVRIVAEGTTLSRGSPATGRKKRRI